MKVELMDVFRMEYDFSWDTETWFVPLETALDGLKSSDASWQPPGGGNTIWQTVNHLNYYNDLLVSRINGTPPGKKEPNNKATFGDTGNPEESEKWNAVVEETYLISEKLRKLLAEVNDSQLEKEYVGGLARHILHNVYHIGQIVLIRKQQGSWPLERE